MKKTSATAASPAANPITPTVGRTVLYVLPESAVRAGEIRPAVVVRVNPDTVNLHVHTDGPNDCPANGGCFPSWVGSASYHQPAEGEALIPGTWHWMDYQLQTAAAQA
jgi:hypothetical protein